MCVIEYTSNLCHVQLNRCIYWHNTHFPIQIILMNYGHLREKKVFTFECCNMYWIHPAFTPKKKKKVCWQLQCQNLFFIITSKKKQLQLFRGEFTKKQKGLCLWHHHWTDWPELPLPTLILIVKYWKRIAQIWATCIWVKIIMFIQEC